MCDRAVIHGYVVHAARRGAQARLRARADELKLHVRLTLARRHTLPQRRRAVEQRDGARRHVDVVSAQAHVLYERLERRALAARARVGDGVVRAGP